MQWFAKGEPPALAEERERVFVHHAADEAFRVAAFAQFENEIGHSGRFRGAPIAGGVYEQSFGAVGFHNVGRPGRRAFAHWVERHAGPKAFVENMPNGVFFHVIDKHPFAADAAVAREHVEDHACALVFILQVGRVDQDLFVGLHREIDMFEKNRGFVASVFVEADLANSEHAGAIEELGNHRDYFAGQRHVFGFFRIDAEPRVVLDAVPTGTFRLESGKLFEIIAETGDAATVVAGPKRGFADRDAAHFGQRLVVVGCPRNHVDVGVDVVHGGDVSRWVSE